MKALKRVWCELASAVLVVLLGTTTTSAQTILDDIPAGTGYAAWELCTRVMASGDDYWRVRQAYTAPKVKPLPLVWDIDFYAGKKVQVQAVLPFLTHRRIGVYRKGLGCTLVTPDTTEATVRAQPFTPVIPALPTAAPWPLGEGNAESQWLSVAQRAVIAHHAQSMFTEPSTDASKQIHTVAVLVAKQGHLVHEQYADSYSRSQVQLGWSMTKTLTALIAGAMNKAGKLMLDRPVGIAQWAGTAKAGITWRQLLNMAPGLSWSEGYEGSSDATQMLFSQANQAGWAADRPFVDTPGTVFTYSTGFPNIAMLGMKQILGGTHQNLYNFYQQQLFQPLGIRGGVIEPDASGTPVGGARGLLRPVDWLKLGQLVANGGQWNGRTVVSPSFMRFMTDPSPASAEYGGFIWRQPSTAIPDALRTRLPSDLVWFAGHMGQYIVVVPSQNLVVLRMGVAFDKDLARNQVFELVADLLETP